MYIEQGYKGKIGLWKYWIIPPAFILFMAVNYIMVINSEVPVDKMMQDIVEQLGSNTVFAINMIPLAVGLFVVLGWTVLIHQQKVTSLTTSRKKIDWKRIFFAFILWGTITAIMLAVDIYFSPEDFVFNFRPVPFFILAILAIVLVPLQTSFEEYLFRGHMMQGLGILVKNRWVPLLVTSFIFGIMHLANPEVGTLGYGIMVFYIGTGLFLGILTLMDEGLELALGFHAANNLIGALLVTADWTAFQTESLYKDVSEPGLGWETFVPIFVIYPILLFVFSKKYSWSNWKERLTGKVYSEEEFLALEQNDAVLQNPS
ncbi:CPBP family intramembrane glutamic endopeptidase [Aurantibacter sp.]|uniref:CPBP family intramembrane glutamic endopeptidase n=1 Tax=Aurantibacter sp. TaxID=2807103 RepID=UPI0032670B0A